jgi:hypothetical protein
MTATTSRSNPLYQARDIELELSQLRKKLDDAVWEDNEELEKALRRQIERLEMLKRAGELYDVNF